MSIIMFSVSRYVCNNFPSTLPSRPPSNHYSSRHIYDPITSNVFPSNYHITIVVLDIPKILFLLFGLIIMTSLCFLQLSSHVRYVTFNTDLTVCPKNRFVLASHRDIPLNISLIMFIIALNEHPENFQALCFVLSIQNYGSIINLILTFKKTLSQILFFITSNYIFYLANTPATCFLCIAHGSY